MKPRHLQPLHLQRHPRCLARRRKSHLLCQAPAMKNGRCRIHGGLSPGAPKNELNGAFKHGRFSQDHLALRRLLRQLTREARDTLAAL